MNGRMHDEARAALEAWQVRVLVGDRTHRPIHRGDTVSTAEVLELHARALYSEYRAADVGYSWYELPDEDRAGWLRVAAYVVRLGEPS